jgi:hypothetical protein
MTLQELRVTSYLYQNFSNYERNYIGVSDERFDILDDTQCAKLMKFLNDWGCRQFKIEDHDKAKDAFKEWYQQYQQYLPEYNIELINLPTSEIESFEIFFDKLKESFACLTKSGYKKTFGAVGAAKALFAIRKHAFPPWDNPIIDCLGLEGNGGGYCKYLLKVKEELLYFKLYCENNIIDFNDLPNILGRPHVSMVKLIDEYYWMNYTRKCIPSKLIEYGKLSHNSLMPIN